MLFIEGLGEVTVGADAVAHVNDGKVIVHAAKLPASAQQAIGHAHDRETE